jgi:hypothetical protein
MTAIKICVACIWGSAAFYSLCYGIVYKSTEALLLFVSLAPLLAVFILWMIDRAALERRIRRLEARSDIADERRIIAQSDLSLFEHKLEHQLEEVETKLCMPKKRA